MNANVVMQVATTKQFGDMEIQVYENPAVDHTRAQDDFYMTREQIGTALDIRILQFRLERFTSAMRLVSTRFQG